MNWKTWLIILLLFSSLCTGLSFNIIADNSNVDIFLVTGPDDYIRFGFTDFGIYYTPNSLTVFHMPFVVSRNGSFKNLNNVDLDGIIRYKKGFFDSRNPSFSFQILGSNDDFYVVDFCMNIKADIKTFSVDFVPKIKGVSFPEFAWWNSSWVNRKEYVINSSFIDTTLSNFPMLFSIDSSTASFCDNGRSIRFVDDYNSTVFNHEIVTWVPSGISYVFVNVTTVNSSSPDTVVNLYYNNPSAVSVENRNDTWNSNYLAVYHMENLTDSKGSYNLTNVNSAIVVSGVVGNCYDFNSGSSQYLYNHTLLDVTYGITGLSFEFWNNVDSIVNDRCFFSKENTGSNFIEGRVRASNPHLRYMWESDGTTQYYTMGANTYTDVDIWKYTAFVGSAGSQPSIWINASENTGGNNYEVMLNGTESGFEIGRATLTEDYYFDGMIDEFRVSRVAWNDSWIKASFHSMNQSNSFISESQRLWNVSPPDYFYANRTSDSSIGLDFGKNIDAYSTVVERNTVSSWNRGSGTEVYNNTGVFYSDTSVTAGTVYYYQAWSYNTTQKGYSISLSSNNLTAPSNPSGLNADLVINDLNISWTDGTVGVDTTVVVRKLGSSPTSPSDGSIIFNASSPDFYVDAGIDNNNFYRLYSYNSTINAFSSGIAMSWGSLTVRVYDEQTNASLSGWGFLTRNSDGSTHFWNSSCTNPLIVDTNDLPVGDNIFIRINLSGYTNRTFYIDIEANIRYSLNCYLAANITTESYVLRVINEYDSSVSDALINVLHFVNDSFGYENATSVVTDGNGYATVNLIPDEAYLLIISADGYITSYEDLVPVVVVYGDERYHTFRLFFTEEEYMNETVYHEIIDFNGYITGNNLIVNYTDSTGNTVNTSIVVFEHNGSTGIISGFYWDNKTGNSDFQLTIPINNSNCYEVDLDLNHSVYGYKHDGFVVCYHVGVTTKTRFDTLFDQNFKHNPFGWSNFFGFIVLIGCLFTFGPNHVGISMLFSGGILLFLNSVIGLSFIMVSIPVVIIALGVVVMFNRRSRVSGG